jgi:hypothetical protein
MALLCLCGLLPVVAPSAGSGNSRASVIKKLSEIVGFCPNSSVSQKNTATFFGNKVKRTISETFQGAGGRKTTQTH